MAPVRIWTEQWVTQHTPSACNVSQRTRQTDAIRVATAIHNHVNSDRETGCQNNDCYQAYYSFLCHSFNKARNSVEWWDLSMGNWT
jgi:hypothetical protein